MKLGTRRPLGLEGLEDRQCFSVDIGAILASLDVPPDVIELVRHNYEQPTDVNVDGYTSPLDVLNIINELNQRPGAFNSAIMADTNGDRLISPLDALIVVNQLNRQADGDSRTAVETSQSLGGPDENAQIVDLFMESIPDSLLADSILTTQDESVGSAELSDQQLTPLPSPGSTYDPTDDNGNGFFLTDESAEALGLQIEAALRNQLQLNESATIKVAVSENRTEYQSGTWQYLTEEGVSIWGNWRQTPDELRLFLSNVEEENRIYGQYPDGSFLYFSWLGQTEVGFYFTPLDGLVVDNPVPIQRYVDYFAELDGEAAPVAHLGSFAAFYGDLRPFDGVQPIEKLLSELYAIQVSWNAEQELSA